MEPSFGPKRLKATDDDQAAPRPGVGILAAAATREHHAVRFRSSVRVHAISVLVGKCFLLNQGQPSPASAASGRSASAAWVAKPEQATTRC